MKRVCCLLAVALVPLSLPTLTEAQPPVPIQGKVDGVEDAQPTDIPADQTSVRAFADGNRVNLTAAPLPSGGYRVVINDPAVINRGRIDFMYVLDNAGRFQAWGANAISLRHPERELVIDPVLLDISGPKSYEANLYQLSIYEQIHQTEMHATSKAFAGGGDNGTRKAMQAQRQALRAEFYPLLAAMPKSSDKELTSSLSMEQKIYFWKRRADIFRLYGIKFTEPRPGSCYTSCVKRRGLFRCRR